MEAKQEKRSNLRTPRHKVLRKIGRMEGTRFSCKYTTVENDTTHTASFGGCLPGLYMNKTLRHKGKIKAIYTDEVTEQKVQYSPDWSPDRTESCQRRSGKRQVRLLGWSLLKNPSADSVTHTELQFPQQGGRGVQAAKRQSLIPQKPKFLTDAFYFFLRSGNFLGQPGCSLHRQLLSLLSPRAPEALTYLKQNLIKAEQIHSEKSGLLPLGHLRKARSSHCGGKKTTDPSWPCKSS